MSKTVPFQTIQFSLSMQFKCKYTQAIQFNQKVLIHSSGTIKPKDESISGFITFPRVFV